MFPRTIESRNLFSSILHIHDNSSLVVTMRIRRAFTFLNIQHQAFTNLADFCSFKLIPQSYHDVSGSN